MDYQHMDNFKELLVKKKNLDKSSCTNEREADLKEDKDYYFCSCSFKKLKVICKFCMQNCHKSHTQIMEVNKNFILKSKKDCECGKKSHKHFIEDKGTKSCFISEILTKMNENEFFKINTKTYCKICKEKCAPSTNGSVKSTGSKGVCACPIHVYGNLKIFHYLFYSNNLRNNLPELNLNILYKSNTVRKKIFNRFKTIIESSINVPEGENPEQNNIEKFYCEKDLIKIFKIFSIFLKNKIDKKYLSHKIFKKNEGMKYENFMKILKYTPPPVITNDNENEKTDYNLEIKIQFYSFLFDLLIKSFIAINNNTFTLKTILCMNIFQRKLFLYNAIDFWKIKLLVKEMEFMKVNQMTEFCTIIFEIYKEIKEHFNSTQNLEKKLSFFSKYTKIVKYMIKYNLISNSLKQTFFKELQNLFFTLDLEKNIVNSVISNTLKSLFYYLLNICDNRILNSLGYGDRENDTENNPKKTNELISIVFVLCISAYKRKDEDNISRNLKFDLIVKKILDILIGKNKFYKSNIENLKLISHSSFDILTKSKENILEQNSKYITNILHEFALDIRKINLLFFGLSDVKNTQKINFNYNEYINQANIIIENFNKKLEENDIVVPNWDIQVNPFKETDVQYDKIPEEKLEFLQNVLKYTKFCEKLREFMNIAIKYRKNNKFIKLDFKEDSDCCDIIIPSQNIFQKNCKFILSFLLLIIYKYPENIIFIRSISSVSFSKFFNRFCQDDLFKFLDIFSDFLFKNPKGKECYIFDNYYFLAKILIYLLNKTNKLDENNERVNKHVKIFTVVFKCSIKFIPIIRLKSTELFDVIEILGVRLNKCFSEEMVNKFFSETEDELKVNFLIWYLKFVNEIAKYNLLFQTQNLFKIIKITDINIDNENNPINIKIELLKYKYFVDMNILNALSAVDSNDSDIFNQFVNIPDKERNKFINYFFYDEDNKADHSKLETRKDIYLTFYKYIEENLINLEVIIDRILVEIPSKERLETFYYFFSNCILFPLFTTISYLDMNRKRLEFKDYKKNYSLIMLLFKKTHYFYSKLEKISPNLPNFSEKSFVKKSIDLSILESSIKELESTKFERYEKYLEIFNSFIKLIKSEDPTIQDNPFKINDKFLLENQDQYFYKKLKDLNLKKHLSLHNEFINAIKCSDSMEYNLDFGEKLMIFLYNKFMDDKTYLYINSNKQDLKYDREKNNQKFQNYYYYIFICKLLVLDCTRFQEVLKDPRGIEISRLIEIIIEKFIFKNLMVELSNCYSPMLLKYQSKLNYTLLTQSFKFLQNLCEGHNKFFQKILFNYDFKKKKVYKSKSVFYEKNDLAKIHLMIEPNEDEEENELKSLISISNSDSDVSIEKIQSRPRNNNKRNSLFNNEISNSIKKKDYFFNLLICNLRLVYHNLKRTFQIEEMKIDNINKIYKFNMDLIIEMIQGTDKENIDFIFQSTPTKDINEIHYQLIYFLKDVRSNLYQVNGSQGVLELQMQVFILLNNIINSDFKKNDELVKKILSILEFDFLIEYISGFMKKIYLKYIKHMKDPSKEIIDKLILKNSDLDLLVSSYKESNQIFNDEEFKLISQIYLFLVILENKHQISSLYKIKDLIKKDIMDDSNLAIVMNNKIATIKFFDSFIKEVEFCLGGDNGKKIFFILEPKVFLISKTSIEAFKDNTPRKNASTKLKFLLDNIDAFYLEVKYYEDDLKGVPIKQFLYNINYSISDYLNFIFALALNLTLIMNLTGSDLAMEKLIQKITNISFMQLYSNLIFLVIFCYSKYKLIYNIEESKAILINTKDNMKKDLNLFNKFYISVVQSILLNSDLKLTNINLVFALVIILYPGLFFICILQLLNVFKFVGTIMDLLYAFQLGFSQVLAMMAFLAILMYVYANIGFFFFPNNFIEMTDSGTTENICQTLLQCFITYFDVGVKSGGGIADIMNATNFDNMFYYYVRLVNDMLYYIIVDILLIYMINGIIIGSFSQLSEENQLKGEDRDNKCYICSIEKNQFILRKKNFENHIEKNHQLENYIYYLVLLVSIEDKKEMDSDQTIIDHKIQSRDIGIFPILRCCELGKIADDD